MVLDECLRTAIITIDPSFCIFELRWHGLTFDGTIEFPERHLHVHDTSAADGTFERVLRVTFVTSVVYAMPTRHEHDCLRGGEHVVSTDWTVAVRRSFDATV